MADCALFSVLNTWPFKFDITQDAKVYVKIQTELSIFPKTKPKWQKKAYLVNRTLQMVHS